MFHLVLYQPQIPPNTGNIIRLCANTGSALHLIRPLGFMLTDKHLQRAGLDYHQLSHLKVHDSIEQFLTVQQPKRLLAVETCGTNCYDSMVYQPGDAILFGSETKGLDAKTLEHIDKSHVLKIPMRPNNRSLNLANAVSIVVYEAWRQNGFQ